MTAKSIVPVKRESSAPSFWADPFGSLHEEIDRLFDDFGLRFNGSSAPAMPRWPRAASGAMMPRMDVAETDKAIELTAELPGLEEKDVSVNLSDDVLTIKGEKKSEKDEKDANYRLVERNYGAFYRAFALPAGVKGDAIQATIDKGVLTVRIPKPEPAVTKKIEVKKAA
jgi:HSP20 family protein